MTDNLYSDRLPEEAGCVQRPFGARWAIVLAGGDGLRPRPMTEKRFGMGRPKQFCPFWGDRTMLQWALDRARSVCGADQTRLVITSGHERFLRDALYRRVLRAVRAGRVPGQHHAIALAHAYRQFGQVDFSRAILQNAPECCDVLTLRGVHWSDCGRPERLEEALRLYARESAPALQKKAPPLMLESRNLVSLQGNGA